MKNNYSWRSVLEVRDVLNQLILLAINLIEIISEIETSLTFCNMNKIHSSITDIETPRKIVDKNSKLDFWEISKLIKKNCRLNNDT